MSNPRFDVLNSFLTQDHIEAVELLVVKLAAVVMVPCSGATPGVMQDLRRQMPKGVQVELRLVGPHAQQWLRFEVPP